MSALTAKSGELFSFVTSGSRGWARYYSESGPAFLRIGNLDHDSVSLDLQEIQRVQPPVGTEGTRTRVQPNDILISITADVGMVGIVPEGFEEAYINQHIALARPTDAVYGPYLAWCLTSPMAQRQFKILQRGATKVGLGLDDIRAVDVPLRSLPEQRRIVAEIEKQFTRLDAGVAALRRVQANLKRYRAAILKAACEGKLVPTEAELSLSSGQPYEAAEKLLARTLTERRLWFETRQATAKTKKEYREPVPPGAGGSASLPKGWVWATWDQLSNWVTYGFTRPMPHVEKGIPIITARSVNKGRIDLDGAHLTTNEAYDKLSEKDCPQTGDILITKDGTIGRAAVVDTDRAFCINQSVAVIWLRSCPLAPKFLLIVIDSELTQKPIWAKARGVAIQHLSITDFAKMALPIPPLAEQTRIVAEVERRLSVVEELEAVVSANLQRAARLRQSILQKAFTGNL